MSDRSLVRRSPARPRGLAERSRRGGSPARAALIGMLAFSLLSPPGVAQEEGAAEAAGDRERAPGRVTALVGGTLIDGYGAAPLRNSVVLIEGERIRAVGREGELEVPEGAEVISTEGMSVLPGLWDMHVHLMIAGHADYAHWDSTYPAVFGDVIMPASAEQLLRAGVTSARDLGGPLEASLSVRDRIERGEIPGPTLYVSGPFIQEEPYPGTELFRWGVDGVEDARAKVGRLADAGVDVIKLIDQDRMAMEEVRAVVDEAHARGLPVVAHAHRPEEILRGLEAGVDDFEHTGMQTAPAYPPEVMEAIRARTARGAAGPLWWTPTISPLYDYTYLRDRFPERLDAPCAATGLPDSVVADIRGSLERWERLPYYQAMPQREPTLARKFAQLREAGVGLLIGTDSGVPGNFHCLSTWNELDAWVNRLGVEPMTAIRAATYWPAVAMGVQDEVGTVSAGKYADIVAVRGDVLRHVSLLSDPELVIKRGRIVRQGPEATAR